KAGKARRAAPPAAEPDDGAWREVTAWFAAGNTVDVADDTPAAAHRAALDRVGGLVEVVRRHAKPTDAHEETLLLELALEGLHQSSVLARDDLDGRVSFRDMLQDMLAGMEGED
ncbi:MAG TPA: hypothetical protein VFS92_01735, partial [Planctomycetota bacterium]|nr:hypothetical protein [Planctomycetota bacterium]